MIDATISTKIRTQIKRLKKKKEKYSLEEAFKLISKKIQEDEGLLTEEMVEINQDIRARLKENWPL